MTLRQKILKAVYPAWTWWGRFTGKNTTELSNKTAKPQVSFYTLNATRNDGSNFDLTSLKGKKVLVVNTASDCGYTPQYSALQQLSEQYRDKVVVLGFPANDFKEQEKGTDEEIASFCKLNFGVTFPLMKKSVVIKGNQQNDVFKWLTDPSQNGWNKRQPSWNFSKYLVDEQGMLINYFDPAISPMDKDVLNAIEK